MAEKKTYRELLLDPQWQKKRLQIFGRDNFSCVRCGDDAKTLHVHHRSYLRGKKPWEYPDEFLETLCETCHEDVGLDDQRLREAIGHMQASESCYVIGYIWGGYAHEHPDVEIPMHCGMEAVGLAQRCGLDHKKVMAAAVDGSIRYRDIAQYEREG